MADTHSIWNLTEMLFPRKTMHPLVTIVYANASVAAVVFPACVNMTAVLSHLSTRRNAIPHRSEFRHHSLYPEH